MRVVVVDDSAALRARLVAMIRESSADTRVDEARDGAEALEIVRAVSPELVILDLQLPDLSGFQILATIKQAPRSPCVLILTNHATEHYRRECLSRGADYFFDKSMEFDRVADVLSDLGRRRASSP